jgi:hypothetical protein
VAFGIFRLRVYGTVPDVEFSHWLNGKVKADVCIAQAYHSKRMCVEYRSITGDQGGATYVCSGMVECIDKTQAVPESKLFIVNHTHGNHTEAA